MSAAFAGTLATTLQRLKAYDPESKGLVERRNGFFETSFMPGRDFESPADFDTQFGDWLIKCERPDRAHHQDPSRSTGSMPTGPRCWPCRPWRRRSGWVNRVRLGRDYYVRLDSSDYSVDPAMIGRFVDVTGDLSRVEVRHEGRLIAAHDRVWARGMTLADPAHVAAAKVLRAAVPTTSRPLPAARRARRLTRDLADYDRAFGLVDAGRRPGRRRGGLMATHKTTEPTATDALKQSDLLGVTR